MQTLKCYTDGRTNFYSYFFLQSPSGIQPPQ